MDITTLNERPELFQETNDLIESAFGYSEHNKFHIDFLPLMHSSNFHQCHIIVVRGKVVAHIGVNIKTLTNKKTSTTIGLLGGIVVHPEYRGQKYFEKLMNTVLEKYHNKVSFFLLWSNLVTLYKKFKFVGGIEQVELEQTSFPHNDPWKKTHYKNLSREEQNEVKDLYGLNLGTIWTGLKRDSHDWEIIQDMSSCHFYIKKIDNKIAGYFFKNKGQDLPNIIHEFALKAQYHHLILEILSYGTLWVPQFSKISSLMKGKVLQSGLIRIGNLKKFSDFVFKWTNEKLLIEKIFDDSIQIKLNGSHQMVSIEELINIVFGSRHDSSRSFQRPAVYISGLDSI